MRDVEDLPELPSRDNWGNSCSIGGEDRGLPDHIEACTCPEHDGVCRSCGFKITLGSQGREYGHARPTNRKPEPDGKRRACEHRPVECNPNGAQSPSFEGENVQGGQDA